MEYDYVHYNHIGAFRCTKCGHHKPATDYTATALDLGRGTLTIDSSITIQLAFRSIYNVYNILAAYAACQGVRRGGGHRRRGHQQLHPEERTDAEIHPGGAPGDAADQQA